ncbi:hypothetical protein ACEK07_04715 [Alcanivoracaceae bacterium MT1]
MLFRKGLLAPSLIFFLTVTLFPDSSFAIQTGNREASPSFLVDIKTTVRTTYSDGTFMEETNVGGGALISHDLVVTAAHVIRARPLSEEDIRRGTRREITNVFVIGTDMNGYHFTFEPTHYAAISDLYPNPNEDMRGHDIAILAVPIDREHAIEFLPLPHEVGVAVSEQREVTGTIYGQRIPDRAPIERAYDQLFTPEGRLTDLGRREFENPDDGPYRRWRIANELVLNGSVNNRRGQPAPFVRMRIPHSPRPAGEPDLFAGELPQRGILSFDMDREEYINRAFSASEMLPTHAGDSGSPFVSRSPNGQPFLAGVVSRIFCEGCDNEGVSSVYRFIPGISTADLHVLLRERFGNVHLDPNRTLWRDPANNVPSANTWSDDNGVHLSELPDDWLREDAAPPLCDPDASRDSRFCRCLQREPNGTYEITATEIGVRGPSAATFSPLDSSEEFRLYGEIAYYSPQNDEYNDQVSSPINEPEGIAFVAPQAAPRRFIVGHTETNGERETNGFFPIRSSETVLISADEEDPVICLATPDVSGVFTNAGAGVERVHTLVPGGETACIVPSETTSRYGGGNVTHDVWLGNDEHTEGVEILLDIKPSTANQ